MDPEVPDQALVLLFALEELRVRHGHAAAPDADPRSDTGPFRAFRAALLAAAAARAVAPGTLDMWWEGTFNGYTLAVQLHPAGAAPGLLEAAAAACPVEAFRLAPPRPGGYPLARIAPGSAEPRRDADGATVEAPLGAPTGHFGAPGMRRIR